MDQDNSSYNFRIQIKTACHRLSHFQLLDVLVFYVFSARQVEIFEKVSLRLDGKSHSTPRETHKVNTGRRDAVQAKPVNLV